MRTLPPLVVLLLAIALTSCSGSDESPETQPQVDESDQTSSATASPSAEPTPNGPPAKDVELNLFPPIAQTGEKPARSAGQLVATAVVRPAADGSEVLLQRQQQGGWQTVARGKQDDTGTVVFDDVVQPGGAGPDPYRAAVRNPDEPQPVTSQNVDGAGWATTFGDEFDGGSLDRSKWDYRQLDFYNPDGSRQCSKSDESAVSVSGGTLNLQVRQDAARSGESCVTPEYGTHDYYLNGHVSTENSFTFTHGVAASRVKFQQGRGQHGAFWMQKVEGTPQVAGQPGVSGAEIDIVEFFGKGYEGGGLSSFVYYLNSQGESEKVGGVRPQATRQLPSGDAWWRRYHVFSVEWTPEDYVFRVDGRPIFRTNEGVSDVPQFVILSLLSSDWELKKIEPRTLPSNMQVDWVRVWQRID